MVLEFDDMADDTATIISDWETEVAIQSKSVSYDNEGNPTISWSAVATLNVVWEDTKGRSQIEVAGEFHSYEAKMYCPDTTTVEVNNRVVKDSKNYIVEFVKIDKDKKVVYLKEQNV
ncbi:MAG: head-tail adaptor protein [Candidatus Cloacimonetes bacterium]|nr:head-tail adaptor protein [Candidatus Cloacimonadota bacterium]